MLTRRDQTAQVAGRPFNNLLRRLNAADYALLHPHLTADETKAGDLLYNPGDNVQIVHFPCGPTLVSYMVPNEDGRDVETILIGREGAVGGIGLGQGIGRVMADESMDATVHAGDLVQAGLGGFAGGDFAAAELGREFGDGELVEVEHGGRK